MKRNMLTTVGIMTMLFSVICFSGCEKNNGATEAAGVINEGTTKVTEVAEAVKVPEVTEVTEVTEVFLDPFAYVCADVREEIL